MNLNKNKYSVKYIIICIVLAYITTFSFYLNMEYNDIELIKSEYTDVEDEENQDGNIEDIKLDSKIENELEVTNDAESKFNAADQQTRSPIIILGKVMQYSLEETSSSAIILFMFFIFFYLKTMKIRYPKLSAVAIVISVIFAFFEVFGYSFYIMNSWDMALGTIYAFIKALIKMSGYSIMYYAVIVYIYWFFKNIDLVKGSEKINNKFKFDNTEKKQFLKMWLIMAGLWFIYLIIFYPGVTAGDTYDQIKQFLGLDCWSASVSNLISEDVLINNHHPVLHTWTFGLCINIGRAIGYDNFGIFIYAFCQLLIMSLVFCISIYYMIKCKMPAIVSFLSYILYCIWPIFPMWAICMGKDTSFSFWNLLYVVLLLEMIMSKGEALRHKSYCMLLFATNLLFMMTRNNGKYVMIIMTFILIIIYRKNWKELLLVQAVPLFLYMIIFIKVLLPALSISSSDTRQLLSIPFQQTARYVVEYGHEIEASDKEIIDKVLKYDQIALEYNPIRATVKNAYNKEATKVQMNDYFKVWFKYLLKRPGVYIEATMNNCYGYFYPEYKDMIIFSKIDSRITEKIDEVELKNPEGINALRYRFSLIVKFIRELPVIGIFTSMGFSTWIIMLGIGYLIVENKKIYIVAYTPMILNILVCMASPKITLRYALPVNFCVIFLTAVTIYLINNNDDRNNLNN